MCLDEAIAILLVYRAQILPKREEVVFREAGQTVKRYAMEAMARELARQVEAESPS